MKIQTVIGFQDATPLLADPAALRKQALRDGYLFFKGLLPRDEVLALRRQVLEILDFYGFVDSQHDLMNGVGDPAAGSYWTPEELTFCGVGVPRPVYRDVQRLERFHRLAHHPSLIGLYERLFGASVLPHPRNIARLMVPSPHNVPTPPHQDYIHIQGTPNAWTCWFPLGDAPVELGNLAILAGTHRHGVLKVQAAAGAGGAEAVLPEDFAKQEWVVGDYAAGDVITFHSHTVHKSLPNQLGHRIRLSCDYRYQPVAEPIHAGSLEVHCAATTWEDIYAEWPANAADLKYYWKNQALNLAEWNDSIRVNAGY